jgi:CRP/FNR family cyclic AMP-dependent transcriptional regulator
MSETKNFCDILRSMPVFGGLQDQTLEFLLERSETRIIPTGEFVFRENDPAHSFFVLKSGSVVAIKQWQGNDVQLKKMQAGDCFGEMAILDLQPRSASVRVADDCEILEIPRHALHQLYQTNQEQYTIIMLNLGREVSRRLRIASDKLFALDHAHGEQVEF